MMEHSFGAFGRAAADGLSYSSHGTTAAEESNDEQQSLVLEKGNSGREPSEGLLLERIWKLVLAARN